MKKAALLISIYAFLVLLGGIIGYYKAASIASLASGVVFGLTLAVCAWITFKNQLVGVYTALGTTLVLEMFFIYRFTLSWKFMPAGMMSAVSLAVASALLVYLRRLPKKEKVR